MTSTYALDAIQDPSIPFRAHLPRRERRNLRYGSGHDSTDRKKKWLSGIAIQEGLGKLNRARTAEIENAFFWMAALKWK
jgi:hypothetical protein